jgi:hypothetical protein
MSTPNINPASAALPLNEFYVQSIKPLPAAARLELATLILNDIPPQAVVDYQTEWSEEDLRDATAYSLLRAGRSLDEEDDA